MKEKIIILGGKGTAVVVAEHILNAIDKFKMDVELLGFAFDDPSFGKEINGIPIVCKTYEAYKKYKEDPSVKFIFLLYRSDILEERIKLRNSYGIPLDRFATFIHPTAFISRSAKIGNGCVLLSNVVINSNAVLGNFTTMNANSLIGHDTILGENNFIAAHTCIGSHLIIGNGNFTGLNSSIRNFVKVGDYNLIGMASNVIKDLENHTVVVGNPAKKINK